ncbi:hypothetical protein K501DRAFT_196225 [Backusella circina FSU 941]|nr:hypothetical protein K501DRAFT_196225 [Backusella circina FSU 941]
MDWPPLTYSQAVNNDTTTIVLSNSESVIATSEHIPTATSGPFTIVVVVFLVLITCLILNCSRVRRTVSERRMDKLGLSSVFKKKSFEKRHKELQEADIEWNSNPPMVYLGDRDDLTTPETVHSKSSSLYSSGYSSTSTMAQTHHYTDQSFIKNQPPGIQLRLALENASSSSSMSSSSNVVAEPQPARTSNARNPFSENKPNVPSINQPNHLI